MKKNLILVMFMVLALNLIGGENHQVIFFPKLKALRDAKTAMEKQGNWQITAINSDAIPENLDINNASIIAVDTYKSKIPNDFYTKKIIPAVENGAILIFVSYYGIDKLAQIFKDKTFEVKCIESKIKDRKPTFLLEEFAKSPNDLSKRHTGVCNFLPTSPNEWIILGKSKSTAGKDAPYIIARKLGKGLVVVCSHTNAINTIIENLLEYDKKLSVAK